MERNFDVLRCIAKSAVSVAVILCAWHAWELRHRNCGLNPYPTAFPYGNDMVLHFYQQQESRTTKTVHKVINKGLKTYVLSLHTGENFH